jgi:hypothetical protein
MTAAVVALSQIPERDRTAPGGTALGSGSSALAAALSRTTWLA